jgi:hypothetical protein
VRFVGNSGETRIATTTFPIGEATVADRLAAYLDDPADSTRFYALYRTDVLRRAFPPRDFHAYDWPSLQACCAKDASAKKPKS